jgi:hypothetical protein
MFQNQSQPRNYRPSNLSFLSDDVAKTDINNGGPPQFDPLVHAYFQQEGGGGEETGVLLDLCHRA